LNKRKSRWQHFPFEM